jgi:hypothetical protein
MNVLKNLESLRARLVSTRLNADVSWNTIRQLKAALKDLGTGRMVSKVPQRIIRRVAKDQALVRREEQKMKFEARAWSLINEILDMLTIKIRTNPNILTPRNAAILLGVLLDKVYAESSSEEIEITKTLKLKNIPDDVLDKMIEMARREVQRQVIDGKGGPVEDDGHQSENNTGEPV